MTQLLHYPHSSQSVPIVAAYKYNIKLFFQTDDVKKLRSEMVVGARLVASFFKRRSSSEHHGDEVSSHIIRDGPSRT